MANIKKKLADAGISVGGDLKVYGDFIMTGATKEVHFHDGTHYHGMEPPVQMEDKVPQLPAELDSPKARKLLFIAVEEGWLNDQFQPTFKLKTKAALLARRIGELLLLTHPYRPFEQLWGMTRLSKSANDAMGSSTSAAWLDELKRVLK